MAADLRVLLREIGIMPRAKNKKTKILVKSIAAARKGESVRTLPEKPLPKDLNQLRKELDEAVIAGVMTGTDARDIMHSFAAGECPRTDLAVKLAAVLE